MQHTDFWLWRTIDSGFPKAAEEAMDNLKSYVVFVHHWDILRNMSPTRIFEREEIGGPC
jgi:hypothetical protein